MFKKISQLSKFCKLEIFLRIHVMFKNLKISYVCEKLLMSLENVCDFERCSQAQQILAILKTMFGD